MAALTLRSAAGRPLSNAEVDGNFSALNTELGQKLVAASNLSDLPNTATARTNLGLGSVENKSSATIRSELTSNNVTSALGFTPYNSTNPAGYITSGASITGTAAGLTNNSSWLLNRGGVADTSIDSAIANGFYTVNRVDHSTSLFSWNASGSTGPVQLDFHYAGSFSFRSKTESASWNAWKTVLTNSNYNNYSPSLTGSGASGTWGINVTGSAGSVAWGNVSGRPTAVSAFTNDSGYINSSASISGNAATATNATGAWQVNTDTGNKANALQYWQSSGDTEHNPDSGWNYAIRMSHGDAEAYYSGTLALSFYADSFQFRRKVDGVNQSWRNILHDGNYASYALPLAGGTVTGDVNAANLVAKRRTYVRHIEGKDWDTLDTAASGLYLNYDSNQPVYIGNLNLALHAGNYNSYSPSLTGSGASGTWGINITGSAGTATSAVRIAFDDGPRDLSNRLPNSFTRTVNFDFVGAGVGNGTGNYAGVMTFSPWTGTTASTGDSSYQLAFANTSGVNASGQPKLSIRNGIDSTWNAWYTLLHAGNYTSYSPSLTGSGASGTWGINVTGSAGTVNLGGHVIDGNTWAGSDGYHGYRYNGGNWRFGFSSNGGVVDVYSDGNFYATDSLFLVLHAGNYSSYALPLSGGTVSGAVTFTGGVSFGPSPGDPYPYIGARTVPAGDPNAGNERTELILFHSNDPANAAGPDFITLRAPCIRLQTYNNTSVDGPNNMEGSINSMYLDFNGNATFRGAVTQSSDERLKSEWQTLPSDFVEKLAQVKNGTFLLNEDPVRQVGVSAQSLQTALPEAVSGEETLTVAYGNAALVSAIELAKKIVELEAKIELLMQNTASN